MLSAGVLAVQLERRPDLHLPRSKLIPRAICDPGLMLRPGQLRLALAPEPLATT
jgi:hypothetical protein